MHSSREVGNFGSSVHPDFEGGMEPGESNREAGKKCLADLKCIFNLNLNILNILKYILNKFKINLNKI